MKYLAGMLAITFAAIMTQGQLSAPQEEVPAYHAMPASKGATLPPILTPAQLAQAGLTLPSQKESYKAAARLPSVLYQLPCYCHCDRHAAHTSLRSCFEGTHGANCSTCMAETLYAYQHTQKGW